MGPKYCDDGVHGVPEYCDGGVHVGPRSQEPLCYGDVGHHQKCYDGGQALQYYDARDHEEQQYCDALELGYCDDEGHGVPMYCDEVGPVSYVEPGDVGLP